MSEGRSDPDIVDARVVGLGPAERGLDPQPHLAVSKPFPWGCLIGGCLSAVLLMVGGLVAVGVGSFWLYKQQVAQYTSDQPRQLPVVEVSPDELKALERRVEGFQEKVDKGETPEQLILTADDLNALIGKEEKLRGKVFVTIEDGLIQADVSIPTDFLPGAKGRFFNGSVSADASLEDGVLIVTLESAEVNGTPVPEEVMVEIRKQNLAKDMYKDPNMAKKLRKFESLVIKDNRIVLTPKVEKAEATEAVDPNLESQDAPSGPVIPVDPAEPLDSAEPQPIE